MAREDVSIDEMYYQGDSPGDDTGTIDIRKLKDKFKNSRMGSLFGLGSQTMPAPDVPMPAPDLSRSDPRYPANYAPMGPVPSAAASPPPAPAGAPEQNGSPLPWNNRPEQGQLLQDSSVRKQNSPLPEWSTMPKGFQDFYSRKRGLGAQAEEVKEEDVQEWDPQTDEEITFKESLLELLRKAGDYSGGMPNEWSTKNMMTMGGGYFSE